MQDGWVPLPRRSPGWLGPRQTDTIEEAHSNPRMLLGYGAIHDKQGVTSVSGFTDHH